MLLVILFYTKCYGIVVVLSFGSIKILTVDSFSTLLQQSSFTERHEQSTASGGELVVSFDASSYVYLSLLTS